MYTPEQIQKMEQEIIEQIQDQQDCDVALAVIHWISESDRFLRLLRESSAIEVLDILERHAYDDDWDGGKTSRQAWEYHKADEELRKRLRDYNAIN